MRIKLDENLPAGLLPLLTALGHEVDTVPAEGTGGEDDDVVWRAAQADGRFLVTQDLDFSDARKYAPGTRGRFALNKALPIAFDGGGALEVDLLCADARLALELDGAQHLADPVAYRRDRRKDQLLQENGYFVLRFLADDVGKELDSVLDAILRVLSRRRA